MSNENIRDRLQYSGAKMAAGESSQRQAYIVEASECKVVKHMMECWRDVEEVGKEPAGKVGRGREGREGERNAERIAEKGEELGRKKRSEGF